jgi:hypothetical protein
VTSPLVSSIAQTIGKAMAPIFLDATLTRDVPGTIVDPADPPAPTQATFSFKGIEQEYGSMDRAQGLVGETDIQILILASTLSVDPRPLDRLTIRGRTVTIVAGGTGGMPPVKSDPARATWHCRCRT